MRFKTFTTICYRFPIKSVIIRVLPPESAEDRRREIAKMEEHQEFTEDLKDRVFRWQEMEDGKRWWTGKTERREGNKEETSKSCLQMRIQGARVCLERCV